MLPAGPFARPIIDRSRAAPGRGARISPGQGPARLGGNVTGPANDAVARTG